MRRSLLRELLVSIGLTLVAGCATSAPPTPATVPPAPGPPALRVGVTPEDPPVIFKTGGNLEGVEADFARMLGRELGRPVEFVEMEWENQIPALLAGRTDIIMSGMTVTQSRQVRIAFTDSYARVALAAVMRAADKGKYPTLNDLSWTQDNVGVIPGTTGDAYVQRQLPHAVRVEIPSPKNGAMELIRRRIDLFVHDGPVAMWIVSENEADLVGFPFLLEEQFLAWGVRRGEEGLLRAVNSVLAGWKRDGTVDRVVTRWMPWRKTAQ